MPPIFRQLDDFYHFGFSPNSINYSPYPNQIRRRQMKKTILVLLGLVLAMAACTPSTAEPSTASQTDPAVITVYRSPT